MKSLRSIISISFLISIALLAMSASSAEVGLAGSPRRDPSPQHGHDSGCGDENNILTAPGQTAPNSGKQCVELRIDTAPDNYSTSNPNNEPLVPHASVSLMLDDGFAEDSYAVGSGDRAVQFIWLNRFTPDPSAFPFSLDQIQVLFLGGMGISIGDPIDLVVYQDLDGEPPDNAAWLATYHKAVKAIDGSTWSVYSLNPPVQLNGPGDVLIGVINRFVDSGVSPLSYPASIDESSSERRSWRGWWFSDPPDPPILPPDEKWALIDDFLPGNWMIRGYGETLLYAPNLISPVEGESINDNTPHFDWSSVTGATLYKLQVDNEMNFSNPEVDITTSNTTYTPPSSLADEKYYWRVQARDGSGIWGLWSSPTWSFTINTIRNAPNLITPADGATIKDNTPQFDWSSVPGATLYKLQVDNDMNFSNPEVDITTSNTTYTPPSSLADEKYYWRVQARDGSGIWGLWSSPTWSFTINTIRKSFLPISMKEYIEYFEGPNEVEPNNDWEHANGAIRSGKKYYGYPDEKDYFSFYTSDSGTIKVELTNHTGQGVQLQLFYQNVSNRVAWDSNAPFNIELTNQPPGRYFIYIYAKSGYNQVNKYTLKANYP